MTAAARKRAIRIVGSLLLLMIMAFVFPRHKLLQALRGIPSSTLAAALPAYVALHFLGSLKWQLMVSRDNSRVTFLEGLRCYFGGLFANLFLPSVVGGDIVTMALGISANRSKEQIVSGTLASRILDLAALAFLVALAIFAFPSETNSAAQQLIRLLLLVLIGVIFVGFLVAVLLRRTILSRGVKYWHAFAEVWHRPGRALAAFSIGVLMQAGLIALSGWIGVGCGLHLPARAWLFAWPLAKLSGFVPVTLAGIGSRELVLPALLAPFGADPAAAASVGLAWDAILIIGSLVGGLISKMASLARP